jgi:hypothetical protein
MKKHFLSFSIGAMALMFSSCATIFCGTKQKIAFSRR